MSLGIEESATENQVHFTYKSNPDMDSLCQGDILRITDELQEILTTVHPYFNNEQYKYFCDFHNLLYLVFILSHILVQKIGVLSFLSLFKNF